MPTSLADGRYLLVSGLGEGGMATVYRAYDQRLQVWRAIKILAPQYASKPKLRSRFEAEAQTMALLEHRNIVRVYDVGHDGPYAYIVMELVEGGSLVDWLERNGGMRVGHPRRGVPGHGFRHRPGRRQDLRRDDEDRRGDGYLGVHGARAAHGCQTRGRAR
ncbi:MAG: protein kinase [Deltaproteobacteria bacterium]|nr:protein kinase [Deltaproteobacteria bacterium]